VMLDMPDKEGDSALIEAKLGAPGAPGFPLFAFKMEGEALPPRGSISPLPAPDLPAEIKLQRAVRAEMTITGGLARDDNADDASLATRFPDVSRIFSINNGANAGFTGKPLARVKRKQELVLAIANKTAFPQVIAVHGHAFRVLHPFDDGWDPYFLDTLFLAPGATWRIALMADKPGKWAIRSTIAEHFTGGAASWFEVV
jgi:FtsP/CotA-like multicopper oxidase with cupredoxin domain